MKYILSLSIILFVSFNLFSQSQISNGNFENWTDSYNANDWNSINFGFPLEIHSAIQTSDSYQGDYAADLTTMSTALGTIPGIITLGEIDIENQTISGGVPFTERPTGISYFFKYIPNGNDTSYMISILTKWNEANQETDTIALTGYFTSDTYDEYSKVAVPYIYNSEENPDTLNIVLLSSGFAGNAGSSLIIDSLAMEYGIVVSPTLCLPASDTTSSQFIANWMLVPNASSYNLDVSENSEFSSFVTGYENLNTGNSILMPVSITNPGIYFYRSRVNYDTEISINSNTIAVPTPTECYDATNISHNTFTINWQAANNASNYFLDLATNNNFETFVSGYENNLVGNVTNYEVTGLEQNTEYFYRIRVEYDTYLSNNSNTISVNTTNSKINNLSDLDIEVFSKDNNIFINSNIHNIPKEIQIYDINGKLIKQSFNKRGKNVFSTNQSGFYIVKIKYQDKVICKKVIISK